MTIPCFKDVLTQGLQPHKQGHLIGGEADVEYLWVNGDLVGAGPLAVDLEGLLLLARDRTVLADRGHPQGCQGQSLGHIWRREHFVLAH